MEVKGTAVASIPLFIEKRFGKQGLDKWLNALSDDARQVFSSTILSSKWYPIQEILIEPTRVLCDLFYHGMTKGAKESGEFSAEYGLKGILKIFVKIGSPNFIISRASTILPTYYRPSKIEVVEATSFGTRVRITDFQGIDSVVEHRILGWIYKALSIQGCCNIHVEITKSLAKGDDYTEYDIKWAK